MSNIKTAQLVINIHGDSRDMLANLVTVLMEFPGLDVNSTSNGSNLVLSVGADGLNTFANLRALGNLAYIQRNEQQGILLVGGMVATVIDVNLYSHGLVQDNVLLAVTDFNAFERMGRLAEELDKQDMYERDISSRRERHRMPGFLDLADRRERNSRRFDRSKRAQARRRHEDRIQVIITKDNVTVLVDGEKIINSYHAVHGGYECFVYENVELKYGITERDVFDDAKVECDREDYQLRFEQGALFVNVPATAALVNKGTADNVPAAPAPGPVGNTVELDMTPGIERLRINSVVQLRLEDPDDASLICIFQGDAINDLNKEELLSIDVQANNALGGGVDTYHDDESKRVYLRRTATSIAETVEAEPTEAPLSEVKEEAPKAANKSELVFEILDDQLFFAGLPVKVTAKDKSTFEIALEVEVGYGKRTAIEANLAEVLKITSKENFSVVITQTIKSTGLIVDLGDGNYNRTAKTKLAKLAG